MLIVIVAFLFLFLLLSTGFMLLRINKNKDQEATPFTKLQLGITNIVWAFLIGILIVLRFNEAIMHSGFFLVSLKASIVTIVIPFLYLYASNKLFGDVMCLKRYIVNLVLPICLLLLWVFFIIVSKTTQVFQSESYNYISYWKGLGFSYIAILLLQIGGYSAQLIVNYVTLKKEEKNKNGKWGAVRNLLIGIFAALLWVYSLLNHQVIVVVASYIYLILFVAFLFYLEAKETFRAKQKQKEIIVGSVPDETVEICVDHTTMDEKDSGSMRLIIERIDYLLHEDRIYKNPNITLSSFARMIPTNETYLREAIKRHYNCSYTDLLSECRLVEVECMLLEKEAQVNELYEEVGFNSSSAFYAAFKKKHNMAPTQWIQLHKQE